VDISKVPAVVDEGDTQTLYGRFLTAQTSDPQQR